MEELATLKLSLIEEMPAHALQEIIYIVDTIYIYNFFLTKAEQFDGSIPDNYSMEPEESLDIFKLEIGTPNFIEFIGQAQHLMPAVAFIAAALGLSKIVLEIVKLPIEFRKGRLEAKKLKLEIRKLQREQDSSNIVREEVEVNKVPKGILEKANSLKNQNKLSDDDYESKKAKEEELNLKSKFYIPTYLINSPQTRVYTTTT